MDMWYWAGEYAKVLGGYVFLMFLWPSVVFRGHLQKKTRTYRFSFCVTVQIIIVNTTVLIPGLFHILSKRAIAVFFWGVFLAGLCLLLRDLCFRKGKMRRFCPGHIFRFPRWVRGVFWDLRWREGTKLSEYAVLGAVIVYAVAYFSYGAFQIHSYGGGDLYTHHAWIYQLTQGRIFADGVYPQAMHCFVYCLHILLGIRVDSILLFLQNVHIPVFLISAYLLLRQVFHWRYTPIFVLMLFAALDVVSADEIYGMYRLQLTLPLEFGLYTQFLCGLYLARYLRGEGCRDREGGIRRCERNDDLFLLGASVAASVAIHYYTQILAVLVCAAFGAPALRRLLDRKYLIPVLTAAVWGFGAAALPMAGALASGIPFNYSITWALNVMDGSETRELEEKLESEEETEAGGREDQREGGEARGQSGEWQRAGEAFCRTAAGSRKDAGEASLKTAKSGLGPGLKKAAVLYEKGYGALYGKGRAGWIMAVTGACGLLCFWCRRRQEGFLGKICKGYPPILILSFLYILLYTAPFLGLPELIADSRFCSTGHMAVLAVMVIPADLLLSAASLLPGAVPVLRGLSLAAPAGIFAAVYLGGHYRGYLFFELTRYNGAVAVTNSIIENYPKDSFVVVAPTDELYPVIPYGWHEELLTFVKNSREETYRLWPEYIFIYVEKKPFQYSQAHFFEGPSLMGQEKYQDIYWEKYSVKYPGKGSSQAPRINASQVSEEDAQKPLEEIDRGWRTYTRLDRRTALESKICGWLEKFEEQNPGALKVYYEDEEFICCYLRQEPGQEPYDLGIK